MLRPHRLEDLDAFTSFLLHPTATRYMAFAPEQKTAEGARDLLELVISSYETNDPTLSLTIADPATDRYLRSCGADSEAGEVEIYYTVVPQCHGRGIATEATRALVARLVSTTDATIVADGMPDNVASVKVAERLGFVDAGPVCRQARATGLEYDTLVGRRYVYAR